MSKTKNDSVRYRFRAEDFWTLIQRQGYKCALTGRELTPENTEVELRDPYLTKGRGEITNLYLVIRPLAHVARYVPERDIIDLAAEIIQTRGGGFGYGLKKLAKTKRK
jgi:hypothetical protein